MPFAPSSVLVPSSKAYRLNRYGIYIYIQYIYSIRLLNSRLPFTKLVIALFGGCSHRVQNSDRTKPGELEMIVPYFSHWLCGYGASG